MLPGTAAFAAARSLSSVMTVSTLHFENFSRNLAAGVRNVYLLAFNFEPVSLSIDSEG
jgi:hypothetical protein